MFRLISSIVVVVVVVLLYVFAAQLDNTATPEGITTVPRGSEFSNDVINSMRSN